MINSGQAVSIKSEDEKDDLMILSAFINQQLLNPSSPLSKACEAKQKVPCLTFFLNQAAEG
jgi:hypothetical protein